jgi:RNA polymerase sigma factor (sigma-70 family)
MLQQQDEILQHKQYILERSMYRLDPAPPKLPPQEYIDRYFTENDEKYLLWYLHDQEPVLNKIAQSACERYAMTEHFADIKQTAAFGIWTALQKYDSTIGVPFVAFQKRYIADSIEEYIRTSQSGVVTMTTDTYPVMKRIMAIYHRSGDNGSDEAVQRIVDEVEMERKTVKQYLAIGLLNERRADFYKDYDENEEETDEDVTVDYSSEPDKLYSRTVLYNALYAAYDQLTYREQRTLAKHLGFCDSCWSTKKAILKNGEVEYIPIKPMTFEEISHSSSRKSDKASERTFYTALEKMKKYIAENTDYRFIFG